MRTKKELQSFEFRDDMTPLVELLKKENISFDFRKHPIAELEPQVKDVLGYFPSGEWHILIGKNSIIRGMASFGYYEIFNTETDSNPVRFRTAKQMLKEIKKRLPLDLD